MLMKNLKPYHDDYLSAFYSNDKTVCLILLILSFTSRTLEAKVSDGSKNVFG
jgi:hypothetical protein